MPSDLRTAVVAAVAALVLAGCGASSSAPRAAHSTGSQPSAGVSGSSTAHPAAPARRHSSQSAAPTASGGSHSSKAPSPPTSSSTGSRSTSASHHTTTVSKTGPQPVAAGTYTYHQTGSQKIAGFTSAVDPTSTLDVRPARANGEQTSQLTTSSQQPPSDQTVLFNHKGMFLISEVERVKLGGNTETINCTFHPGVPYPPWPVTVGASVHAHTNCGKVNVTASGRVTGRRTAKVGGTTLTVYVVKVTLTTSGQVNSTSTDTEWFSPALRLAVRDDTTVNGRFGPFSFTGTATRTLTSTTPR